jgi:polyphosphate kinase
MKSIAAFHLGGTYGGNPVSGRAAKMITRDSDLSGTEEKMASVITAIAKRFRIRRVVDRLTDRI